MDICQFDFSNPLDAAFAARIGEDALLLWKRRVTVGGDAHEFNYVAAHIDLVCDLKDHGSSVLLRSAVPVLGQDIMIRRRSADINAEKNIKEGKPGFEKKLCRGPCNLGEALGIYPALDGVSLFKPPFQLLRPIEPVTTLLNGPRANVTKDAHLPWRWGHAEYQEWLSQPSFPKTAI